METKFTQGGWEIRPACVLNENEKPLFYDIAVDGGCFLSTHKNKFIEGMDDEMQLANAKLAVAAPEMFEMLKDIYTSGELTPNDHQEIYKLLTKITK